MNPIVGWGSFQKYYNKHQKYYNERHTHTYVQPMRGSRTYEPIWDMVTVGNKSVMGSPTCEPLFDLWYLYMYLCVSRFNNVYGKNEDQVQQSLSNNNQVIICFFFSLSCTSQPFRPESVTSKCTSTPSVVSNSSNSSSVTSETCQVSLSPHRPLSPHCPLSPPDTRQLRCLLVVFATLRVRDPW